MKNYKVTAECVVHIPTSTSGGATLGTLYRGATFLGDPSSEKIKFLVEAGMIVELGNDGTPVPDDEDEQESGDEPQAPEKVTARSNRAELLAYATAHGSMSREDAELLTNKQLIEKFATKGE